MTEYLQKKSTGEKREVRDGLIDVVADFHYLRSHLHKIKFVASPERTLCGYEVINSDPLQFYPALDRTVLDHIEGSSLLVSHLMAEQP